MLFKQLDLKLINTTKDSWIDQVSKSSGEVYGPHYERILDYALRVVEGAITGETCFYALLPEEGGDTALALLELSHVLPGSGASWLKVLSIHVAPQFDVMNDHKNSNDLAAIAARAVVESLGLTFTDYPSKQLKVYASTPMTIAFLEGVSATMADKTGINVSTHGNWLIIDKESVT